MVQEDGEHWWTAKDGIPVRASRKVKSMEDDVVDQGR